MWVEITKNNSTTCFKNIKESDIIHFKMRIRIRISIICFLIYSLHVFAKDFFIENDVLKVTINNIGCFDVTDKRLGKTWPGNRWTGSPGNFTYQVAGKNMDLVGGDAGPGGDNNFSFTAKDYKVDLRKASEIEIKTTKTSASIIYKNFTVSDNKVLYNSRMTVYLNLTEGSDQLIVTIKELTVGNHSVYIQKITYPENFGALHTPTDTGYAVIPEEQGYIIPTIEIPRYSSVYMPFHRIMKEFSGNASREVNFTHSMPWFGMVKDESGWMATMESTENANMLIVSNRYPADKQSVYGVVDEASRIIGVSPVWQTDEGEFGSQKVLKMKFFPTHTNYVTFTKEFRQYLKENHLFGKTLQEKATDNPNVSKLIGSMYIGLYGGYPHHEHHPEFWFTYRQMDEIVDKMIHTWKLKRALFCPWSIFSGQPPANFPIDETKGTIKELKKIVTKAQASNYIFAPFNEYDPVLRGTREWDPKYTRKEKDGSITTNLWSNVCSSFYLDLAKQNIPYTKEKIGVNGWWIDIGKSYVNTCYDPAHPVTLQQDKQNRLDLLQFAQNQKLVVGNENGHWSTVPYVDFFECDFMNINWNVRTKAFAERLRTGEVYVPLFNLVYHDAVVVYGKAQEPDNLRFYEEKTLRNMGYGVPATFFGSYHEYAGLDDMIKLSEKYVSAFHSKIGYDEMTNHSFMTNDYLVEKTDFSSGYSVIVNYGYNSYQMENAILPGRGWAVLKNNQLLEMKNFKVILN